MKLLEVSGITPEKAWHMVEMLSHTIGVSMRRPEKYGEDLPFDGGRVMYDALQMMKGVKFDHDGHFVRSEIRPMIDMEHYMSKLRLLYGSNNDEVGNIAQYNDLLQRRGFEPAEWMKPLIDAAKLLSDNRTMMETHLEAVSHVSEYFFTLASLLGPKSTSDDHDKALIRAVFKNLGMLK